MNRDEMSYTYNKIPIPLPSKSVISATATGIALVTFGGLVTVLSAGLGAPILLAGIAYPVSILSLDKRRKSLARFHNEVVLIARATRFEPVRSRGQELPKPSGLNFHFDEVKRVTPTDILQYVTTKPNRHMFFCGRAGVGKSTLAQWLTMRLRQAKVIFSFKPNDVWLKMGYPILNVQKAGPNPFTDAQSFVSGFLIANPITSQGIQASYIPIMLQKIAEKSSNWNQFLELTDKEELDAKKRRDSNVLAALSWIKAQAQHFIIGEYGKKSVQEYMAENNEMVLDFSEIKNEQAQTFYSEVVLRELYSTRTEGIVIVFDEAHRLLHKQGMSILERYLREGRSKGFTVLCSTQNLTDIDDPIRNNFATQFLFSTTNSDDLTALNKIDPMLAFAASDLPPGVFCDAAQPQIHDDIYLLLLCNPIEREIKQTYIRIDPAPAPHAKVQSVNEEEVLELLKYRPRTPTEMGRILAETHQMQIEDAKFTVSRILTELKTKKGIVDSMRFDLPNSNRFKVLYYLTGANISTLHDFMQNEAERALRKANYKILSTAKSGEISKPDIETEHETIEIETGLKRKFDDLKERLQKSTKLLVIVVPNKDVKELYSKMFEKTNVTCFYDFIESLNKEQLAKQQVRQEEEEIERSAAGGRKEEEP
ncbi:MAG: ATP-binding protein [Candidatus Bathyarchaeia archaeon]